MNVCWKFEDTGDIPRYKQRGKNIQISFFWRETTSLIVIAYSFVQMYRELWKVENWKISGKKREHIHNQRFTRELLNSKERVQQGNKKKWKKK